MKGVRNPFTHRIALIKLAVKELQSAKSYAIFLLFVVLVGIFSLSPAISSLMNDIIIKSTGRIATIATIAPITYKSEIRGVFVHCEGFASSVDWDLIAQTCKDYGIDRIYVEIAGFQGGYYDSDITGLSPFGDQLAAAIAACHSRGLELHISWNILHSPSDDQADMWCVDADLNPYRWGCPTNPATRDWLKRRIEEIVAKYDIDGLMLDYIRYAVGTICYCPYCKSAFEEWIGETITDWPGEFGDSGSRRNDFWEWRTIPITNLVRDIRNLEETLAIKPDLKISLAAWTLFDESPIYWRKWIGQDTADCVGKDYLDIVAPMMYTVNLDTIQDYFTADSDYMVGGPEGKIPLVCFLMTDREGHTPEAVKAVVDLIRELGADGWIMWRYGGPGYAETVAPDIRDYLSILDMPEVFTVENIHVSVENSSATIAWTTSLPATGKVEYSTSLLFNATLKEQLSFHYWDVDHVEGTIIESLNNGTYHSIRLTDLSLDTQYYFRVQSEGSGRIASSRVLTFTTPKQ